MNIFKTARARWRSRMPKFFSTICWVCSLISGTALAANTAITAAGLTPHEWWTDLCPYLIGIPAGMAFAAKFTRAAQPTENPENPGKAPANPSPSQNIPANPSQSPAAPSSILPPQGEGRGGAPFLRSPHFASGDMIEIEPYNDGPNA